MELFNPDGHLTDEGLRALTDGGLDELGRLEAGEHLDFCDACLERYTALLTDDVLLAPAQPLRQPVVQSLRRRGRQRVWLRYGSIAAAACMMLAVWGLGIYRPAGATGGDGGTGQSWVQSAGESVQGFLGGVGDWLGSLFSAPAPQDGTAGQPDTAQGGAVPPKPDFQPPAKPAAAADDAASRFMTPEQREALFEKQNTPVDDPRGQE